MIIWRATLADTLHLMRHDMATHRAMLLAWLLVVLAHPVVAAVPVNVETDPQQLAPGMLLMLTRVVLTVVTVATLVQADSPVDEQAFWRTRPVSSRRMALAKLLLAWLAFVALPVAIVCGVGLAVHLPWHHWPSAVAQSLVSQGALVALVTVVATRTRRVPTLLVALCVVVGALYLLGASLQELRRVPWIHELDILADPALALFASQAWVAAAGGLLCVIAYRGPSARTRFALVCLASLLVLIAFWFLPTLRARRPVPAAVSLAVDPGRMRAERLTHAARVGIVAPAAVRDLGPLDRASVFLRDGTLHIASGPHHVPAPEDPRSVARSGRQRQAAVLAVLDQSAFSAVAGRPARFEGHLSVQVEQRRVVDVAPFAPGGVLRGPHSVLTLHQVAPAEPAHPWATVASGTELLLRTPGEWRPGYEYVLADRRSDCLLQVYAWNDGTRPYLEAALLPVLARPFVVRPVHLTVAGQLRCTPDRTTSELQLRRFMTPPPTVVPLSVEFTVPDEVVSAHAGLRSP